MESYVSAREHPSLISITLPRGLSATSEAVSIRRILASIPSSPYQFLRTISVHLELNEWFCLEADKQAARIYHPDGLATGSDMMQYSCHSSRCTSCTWFLK
jgi:hypothetical protein